MPKITFSNLEEKKVAFAEAYAGDDQALQAKAMTEMVEAMSAQATKEANNAFNAQMADRAVLQGRGHNILTSEEREFFNAAIEEGGFKSKTTLPVTTQERIFEDLVQEHPLLSQLGLQNLGAVTEFIYGDPEGMAVWGELFGDIQGQLNATFRKEKIEQLKLTAFIPISNDMLNLGPEWIERYVTAMIKEAMAVGLERGIVAGNGKNEPIGLLKDLDAPVVQGEYADKESAGTLTFKPGRTTINELKGVVEKLSTRPGKDGKDKVHNVSGKVLMIVNPFDSFGIQANSTIQNSAGQYVQSLPFNPTTTTSAFVPKGKVAFAVKDRYIGATGGVMSINKYDQTLAMEDATLYIARQYATGKPVDNYAVQVYDLDLDGSDQETTQPEGA
ncbi:phage major capsid protein [Alkalicoccobacillus gibsonii]|uniref:phage major capsid protein n=1 Tax=Alkalicoccobacillus gibsonii TaxID=79881 RepID=UPI001932D6A8|nr:phage major capsid protein [Alkalicoccobacillus gibsonii]MBM0064777.1 phage major capsid protein [Alkalicoccobacillus gibsonii]